MIALYKLLRPHHVSSPFVILDYIEKNRGCTTSDIANAMGYIPRTPVHNHFTILRRLSLIETYTAEDLTDFLLLRVFPSLSLQIQAYSMESINAILDAKSNSKKDQRHGKVSEGQVRTVRT